MTEHKNIAPNPVVQRIMQYPLLLVACIGLVIAWAWQMRIGGFRGDGFADGPERLFWISILLANVNTGNMIPKMILRTANDRAVNRLTGWAMVLGSLISIPFWIFASKTLALWTTMAFFGTAMVFLCGYPLLMRIESTRIADIIAVSAVTLAALASAAIWVSEPMYKALPLTIAIFGGTAASTFAYLRTKRARDPQRRPAEQPPHSSVD